MIHRIKKIKSIFLKLDFSQGKEDLEFHDLLVELKEICIENLASLSDLNLVLMKILDYLNFVLNPDTSQRNVLTKQEIFMTIIKTWNTYQENNKYISPKI